MRLDRIILRQVKMRLKTPFASSAGQEHMRTFIIVEAHADGLMGYGEVSVLSAPFYNEETAFTAWHILESFLIPIIFRTSWEKPEDVAEALKPVRRNYMAKAGLEAAVWDLFARMRGVSLAQALGGTRKRIEAGVSIGIEEDGSKLVETAARYLSEGYKRIKVKIKPGWDEAPLSLLRETFGSVRLMADANSAYTPGDAERLRRLDNLGLLMIEQPLAHDDIIDHAQLQKMLSTPICLDESIDSAEDARRALDLGSCRVINIKPARVGGLTEARRLHDICFRREVPVWCGGMFESGIGRAHNIALASLPNFSLPGDISASNRYWTQDIIVPEITMASDGTIAVPSKPGLGFDVDRELLEHFTAASREFINRY